MLMIHKPHMVGVAMMMRGALRNSNAVDQIQHASTDDAMCTTTLFSHCCHRMIAGQLPSDNNKDTGTDLHCGCSDELVHACQPLFLGMLGAATAILVGMMVAIKPTWAAGAAATQTIVNFSWRCALLFIWLGGTKSGSWTIFGAV